MNRRPWSAVVGGAAGGKLVLRRHLGCEASLFRGLRGGTGWERRQARGCGAGRLPDWVCRAYFRRWKGRGVAGKRGCGRGFRKACGLCGGKKKFT
eukprot:65654-Rhodomonas_salina.1